MSISAHKTYPQFSRSVVSDSLRLRELQHARPPCPSPTPGIHSDSTSIESVMPSLCCPFLFLPSVPLSIRVFSSESTLCIRWPKYWSFSFSIIPSKKSQGWSPQNGLVGSPCNPRDSQESSPTPQFKSINSSVPSLHHSPTLTSIHDHRKNHSLD